MLKSNLLITDLDGCLSDNFNYQEIIEHLKLLSNIYDIVICTGREYGSMKYIINSKEIFEYVIGISLANGAIFSKYAELEYSYLTTLEKTKIKNMVKTFQFFKNNIQIYICKPMKTKYIEDELMFEEYIEKNVYEIKIALPKANIDKVNWLINYMKDVTLNFFVDMITNHDYYYIEIKHDGVNKLSTVVNKVDFKQYSEISVLGDSINDMNLFCLSGNCKKYTTNKELNFIDNLNVISSIEDLLYVGAVDTSSMFTNNKVIKCKNIILKKFQDGSKYNTELKAYQIINEKYRPKLLQHDDRNKVLYVENCTPANNIILEKLIKMINEFHASTFHRGNVYEIGENIMYKSWGDYLKEKSSEWAKKANIHNAKDKVEKLIGYIITKYGTDNQVSLLHRDIRKSNIGIRNNEYILFDFELSMWGNPIWDFARMLYEVETHQEEEIIYRNVEYEKKELEIHKCLYAFSFLNYFYDTDYKNKIEIDKCKKIIGDFNYEQL